MKEHHVLNFGMGVESTAIILRWLLEPDQRPCALEDLILLTAQTGDEMQKTKQLCEDYLLPLLWCHDVRFVQIAKHGLKKSEGYTVLSDTNKPEKLYLEGDYKLSDNLLGSGTIPRLGRPHICAQRWKAEPIDQWIRDNLAPEKVTGYLGYNAQETERATKANDYSQLKRYLGFNAEEKSRADRSNEYSGAEFTFQYPLIDWSWSRQDCEDYITQNLGVKWAKSACCYCPFAEKNSAIEKYHRDPAAAAFTLLLEHVALAFNPRMHLFSSGKAYDLVNNSGNTKALELYEQLLEEKQWAVYRVQRAYRKLANMINADRRTTTVMIGSRAEATAALRVLAQEEGLNLVEENGLRAYVHERKSSYPAFEEFYVAVPALAKDKVRNATNFNNQWDALLNPQTSLFY